MNEHAMQPDLYTSTYFVDLLKFPNNISPLNTRTLYFNMIGCANIIHSAVGSIFEWYYVTLVSTCRRSGRYIGYTDAAYSVKTIQFTIFILFHL